MASAKCKCGRLTNSALSNYWEKQGHPTECYAAFVKGEWVKGCARKSRKTTAARECADAMLLEREKRAREKGKLK